MRSKQSEVREKRDEGRWRDDYPYIGNRDDEFDPKGSWKKRIRPQARGTRLTYRDGTRRFRERNERARARVKNVSTAVKSSSFSGAVGSGSLTRAPVRARVHTCT